MDQDNNAEMYCLLRMPLLCIKALQNKYDVIIYKSEMKCTKFT